MSTLVCIITHNTTCSQVETTPKYCQHIIYFTDDNELQFDIFRVFSRFPFFGSRVTCVFKMRNILKKTKAQIRVISRQL